MVDKKQLQEKLNELEDIETGSGGQNPTWPFDSPKNWEEAKGRTLAGEVIKLQKNVGGSGEYDILTVKPFEANHELDAKRLSIFISGTLKQAIKSQDVAEGDVVAIKYHGHREADNPNGFLHDFTLEIVERNEKGKPLYSEEEGPVPF